MCGVIQVLLNLLINWKHPLKLVNQLQRKGEVHALGNTSAAGIFQEFQTMQN